jgi:16S rRNA (guanine(966)-N(2))-methyltransferase RsmD
MDRMRESVFAIIQARLPGSSFLDLFSGSGVIALEAWSRGAARVVMVEQDKGKRQVLTENSLLAEGAATVRIMPVERCLKFMSDDPFDFVFLDPPFPYKFKAQLLQMAGESRLLAEGAMVLIHHPKEDRLPEEIGGLVQTDLRMYGRSVVRFYEKKKNHEPHEPAGRASS